LVTGIAAQNLSQVPPAVGTSAPKIGLFDGAAPFSAAPRPERWRSQVSDSAVPGSARRISLEQVKQSVAPTANPLARLAQLSIEVAKQHRLGVQADYFPQFGATAANLHYTDFLGDILAIRRPLQGSTLQIALPLLSKDQTVAALTFIQPLTPLFMVHQAVRIARADERIAMAKAGVSISRNAGEKELEEIYFRLLIAQRRLTSGELKIRDADSPPLYAGTSIELARRTGQEQQLAEAKSSFEGISTEVRRLSASLNRAMGWPEDTELELVPPDPLVESVSFEEIADKSIAANVDVFEAEQTVVKARAASAISKLAYVPTVAAVSGYLFQNAIPSVPSNFGYGGVIASYNLFDFGKRQRAVAEARAQVEMAELALQMTKAKVAADLKKSYFELEHARQVSEAAQKMGASVARLINASSTPESTEVRTARAEVEVQLLEADFAHRQAFARLSELMGSTGKK
jgi:outer membrane protein TolC